MEEAEIILPEETAIKLLSHPWAGRILPQIYGGWFRNGATGAMEFRARMPEYSLAAFMAAVQSLEGD